MMKKLPLALFALLLLLTGCAEAPPPPVSASARLLDGTRLEIRVSSPAPLDAAELTAPDGRGFIAQLIETQGMRDQEGASIGRPSVVVGGSGGSSSGLDAGIGLSLPIRNPFSSGARQRPYASRAEFFLPAALLAQYRDTGAAGWELFLAYGNSSRSLTAPAPER